MPLRAAVRTLHKLQNRHAEFHYVVARRQRLCAFVTVETGQQVGGTLDAEADSHWLRRLARSGAAACGQL